MPGNPNRTPAPHQSLSIPFTPGALPALRRSVLKRRYDLAIIGSGFGGSILAMIAARLELSIILLEKGSHPRFAIGESTTPLSNLLLEEISHRYNLPALKPLTKWGTWQRSYPELACGLKRGFTFFHHDLHYPGKSQKLTERLLVAASPSDVIADTHWYRADLDAFLVQQAISVGASFLDRVNLTEVRECNDEILLRGERANEPFEATAQFVVDATGPRGILHQLLGLQEAPLPGYPRTESLFGHFSGVKRLDGLAELPQDLSSAIYPVDDAAVHHVFDGGWIWVLRFNNGITSAGVAAKEHCSTRLGLSRGLPAWNDLVAAIPVLREQFAEAKLEHPLTYIPGLSFRSALVTGKRWALLPSAAGFVDPLLSNGFPLTLLGVSRLAEILADHWGRPTFGECLNAYAFATTEELLATSRLIAALYANMGNFEVFRSLSMLYFAAASFSETARRLNKPELAKSFLLHDRPSFGQQCRTLFSRLGDGSANLSAEQVAHEVQKIIEPIDVAGLTRPQRNHAYPVLAEDLIQNAWKLNASREDAVQLLTCSGFFENAESPLPALF